MSQDKWTTAPKGRTVRVCNTTLERLRDASQRYGLTQADIMRKASLAYMRRMNRLGVVELPNRENTTRNASTPTQTLGLDEQIDPGLYGQIANWYLDEKDTGYRRPTPCIDEADLNTPYIIEETV